MAPIRLTTRSNGAVLIREHFRIALIEMSIQVFSLGTSAGLLDQIGSNVNACRLLPQPETSGWRFDRRQQATSRTRMPGS